MKHPAVLTVIGGDIRQVYLSALLQERGHPVRVFALERAQTGAATALNDLQEDLPGTQAVILPMPLLHGDDMLNAPLSNAPCRVSDVLDAIPPGTLTLAGAVPFHVHARAVQNHLPLIDYLAREELAIRNAVPVCFLSLPRYRKNAIIKATIVVFRGPMGGAPWIGS